MNSTLTCNTSPLIIIPILTGLFGIVGFWSTYVVSEHFNPHNATERFPYMSECGNTPPASCWFSQVCNICCMLGLIFEVLRFKNNQLLHENKKILNIVSLVLGIISSLGLSITGNFQGSAVPSVHVISAGVFALFGLPYMWIQVCLIRKTIVRIVGIILCITCSILLCFVVGFSGAGSLSKAAISEWTLATSFFLIYPLFAFDFAKMDRSLP